jgi:hypothetical protein
MASGAGTWISSTIKVMAKANTPSDNAAVRSSPRPAI